MAPKPIDDILEFLLPLWTLASDLCTPPWSYVSKACPPLETFRIGLVATLICVKDHGPSSHLNVYD